ncbi:hypothetical protein NEMIN01_1318 [Nematocida minor]|uniref:uncharacterized protein n=1 Tax=Nematocida minor TaxID=1912983 RepID=UPI002220F3EB|nr:uncharacterized protein NEMIN01_1318 [Nematocida minor]KAI5190985.1 hypothetical protein NEMIN01_1318 [Nematocida minor]
MLYKFCRRALFSNDQTIIKKAIDSSVNSLKRVFDPRLIDGYFISHRPSSQRVNGTIGKEDFDDVLFYTTSVSEGETARKCIKSVLNVIGVVLGIHLVFLSLHKVIADFSVLPTAHLNMYNAYLETATDKNHQSLRPLLFSTLFNSVSRSYSMFASLIRLLPFTITICAVMCPILKMSLRSKNTYFPYKYAVGIYTLLMVVSVLIHVVFDVTMNNLLASDSLWKSLYVVCTFSIAFLIAYGYIILETANAYTSLMQEHPCAFTPKRVGYTLTLIACGVLLTLWSIYAIGLFLCYGARRTINESSSLSKPSHSLFAPSAPDDTVPKIPLE